MLGRLCGKRNPERDLSSPIVLELVLVLDFFELGIQPLDSLSHRFIGQQKRFWTVMVKDIEDEDEFEDDWRIQSYPAHGTFNIA